VPALAAGFSAFGCACADYEYRADKTVRAMIAGPEADISAFAGAINSAWAELRERVKSEFAKSHVDPARVELRHHLRVQYVGQLNDVEIHLPFDRVETREHVLEIITRFEDLYSTMYSRSARSPELGYLVTTAVLTGVVDVEKPRLPEEPVAGEEPAEESWRGTREVYFRGEWITASIYDMERLRPGNRVLGFSVIESPSTTFVVPTGREALLDQHRIFHLSNASA
jgi:acetone carboxylase beta subunit